MTKELRNYRKKCVIPAIPNSSKKHRRTSEGWIVGI
jgi:hypothetical protein